LAPAAIRSLSAAAVTCCAGLLTVSLESQIPAQMGPLDRILDTYVRDGFVYYRALKLERTSLDRYIATLEDGPSQSASRDEQIAFWLNAYNALVLRTVIDHYPIEARTDDLPSNSIRQIPGAFDAISHRIAGRSVTLDHIEQAILPAYDDPRVFLALGRGAVGSPRLRSEAFAAPRLERQLSEVAAECTSDTQCIRIDRAENQMHVSAIFSWREQAFVNGYARAADPMFSGRSPIERAVLALAAPGLLRMEQSFVAANTFEVRFLPFDWTLNDLTGRSGP
jgi:hypothetical protein